MLDPVRQADFIVINRTEKYCENDQCDGVERDQPQEKCGLQEVSQHHQQESVDLQRYHH